MKISLPYFSPKYSRGYKWRTVHVSHRPQKQANNLIHLCTMYYLKIRNCWYCLSWRVIQNLESLATSNLFSNMNCQHAIHWTLNQGEGNCGETWRRKRVRGRENLLNTGLSFENVEPRYVYSDNWVWTVSWEHEALFLTQSERNQTAEHEIEAIEQHFCWLYQSVGERFQSRAIV